MIAKHSFIPLMFLLSKNSVISPNFWKFNPTELN